LGKTGAGKENPPTDGFCGTTDLIVPKKNQGSVR
jgi:hypothetical protein